MRLFDLFSEKRKREEKTEKKEGKGMASGTGNREETGNLPPRPFYSLGKGCYLAYEQKPNGLGGYRDVNVRLYEGERLVRALTDENGQFLDFPGIEHGSWEQHLTRPFEPVTPLLSATTGLRRMVWRSLSGWFSRTDATGRTKMGSEEKTMWRWNYTRNSMRTASS